MLGQRLVEDVRCHPMSRQGHGQLLDVLNNALDEDVPLLTRDGGFVREGFDPALDELFVIVGPVAGQYPRCGGAP